MGEELLSGWGRSTWSRATVATPSSAADVATTLAGAGRGGVIARGLGRSYGDQATNAGGTVLETPESLATREGFAPDPEGRVTVAAGTSIDTLLRALVPQGWFVPVSAGTRHITVGGAVAADIHGKNHHLAGTFCRHVERLTMVLADGAVVEVAPDRDSDLFWATAGGLGLTGVIVDVTLRLAAIETSRLLVDTARHADLDALLDAMVVVDRTAPFSVAWIDLASSAAQGRSVVTSARFATRRDLSPAVASAPLAYDPAERVQTPPWVPGGLLRPSSVRAFNELWFRAAPRRREGQLQSIPRYFHPLDGVGGWNRIYGRQGFVQWQMVVPDQRVDVLRECVEELGQSPAPCFLAVLKRFGPANPGPLSFPLEGWTLAADMPAMAPGLAPLLDRLDVAVAEAGGRIYLAKDARLDPALVPLMYPRLDEWRVVRQRVDPQHRFRSDLSRRLGL